MRRAAAFAALLAWLPAVAGPAKPLPPTLADTGFDRLPKVAYEPRYPLWTDGAAKRRWIHLPAGTAIDASNPDAWEFPVGTRLWKEFGFERPVETRFIEKMRDGSWRYATYLWDASGSRATLAPEHGWVTPSKYSIPSRSDCLACHEGPAVPVLGFTAMQLGAELRGLGERGLVRNLPATLLDSPPAIEGRNATERAALGYLHGNCGHCHNDGALAGVDLRLGHSSVQPMQSARRVLDSLSGRVVPGDPEASPLWRRVSSRNAMTRMPPLGVSGHDAEGLALIERWIRNDFPTPQER